MCNLKSNTFPIKPLPSQLVYIDITMIKYLLSGIFCLIAFRISAQSPTWSGSVAKIVYKNCTSCHHSGGAGPFSMMSYSQTFNNRNSIKFAVTDQSMPPWPPDVKYSKHAFIKALSQSDIETMVNWVNAGAPSGDLAKAPIAPIYDNLGFIKKPELTISTPVYTVTATQDEYRCFPDSTRLEKDMWLTALECIPGNPEIVHHVLIFRDAGVKSYALDKKEAGPGYVCFGGAGTSDAQLIAAWVPGSSPYILPKGFGIKIPAHSNIIIQVHYPGGSKGKVDQTKVKIQLTGIPQRETYLVPILNHTLNVTNGPLVIPPNEKKTFNEKFTLPINASLIGVAPHMHLIGTSIKTWAVAPDNKEIPLISIPQWDFHWQGIYQFPTIVKIPFGSTLYSEATYDNTSGNHHNPNFPPKEVSVGESTTDEMMLTYFLFAAYAPGDENIVIDSSSFLVSPVKEIELKSRAVTLSPNPVTAQSKAELYFTSDANDRIKITVFDINGRVLQKSNSNFPIAGPQSISIKSEQLKSGIYLVKIEGNTWASTVKWAVY